MGSPSQAPGRDEDPRRWPFPDLLDCSKGPLKMTSPEAPEKKVTFYVSQASGRATFFLNSSLTKERWKTQETSRVCPKAGYSPAFRKMLQGSNW